MLYFSVKAFYEALSFDSNSYIKAIKAFFLLAKIFLPQKIFMDNSMFIAYFDFLNLFIKSLLKLMSLVFEIN